MWCDDMRAGHYYRMLQSGPWGVSHQIWGFLSLLAKDVEHYYHAINTFISIHMITSIVIIPLDCLGGCFVEESECQNWEKRCQITWSWVHMYAQNISTGANIPNNPKKSKVKIVSNVHMSAQNIFARANILTVETDRMAVRRILWRAIFVRLWHHEHHNQNQRDRNKKRIKPQRQRKK